MTSGIYRLTFSSGNTYIGKSINIENRWLQHADKFSKGKAAANMQAEFDKCGIPTGEILTVCHPQHISIIEEYYINRHKPPLNGTYPEDPFIGIEEEELQPIWDYLNLSTIEHVNLIITLTALETAHSALVDGLKSRNTELSIARNTETIEQDINNRIMSLLDSMEEQENIIAKLTEANEILAAELAYANKPWWYRLFN